jgi:hypothetical protein
MGFYIRRGVSIEGFIMNIIHIRMITCKKKKYAWKRDDDDDDDRIGASTRFIFDDRILYYDWSA